MPHQKQTPYERACKAADRRFDRSMDTLRRYFDRRRAKIEQRLATDKLAARELIGKDD